MANSNRDPKRRPEPYRIAEFMLFQQAEEAAKGEAKPNGSNGGAKIDPTLVAWLFSQSRKRPKG